MKVAAAATPDSPPLDVKGRYELDAVVATGFKRSASCVRWSPDGDLLAVCSADSSAKLFHQVNDEWVAHATLEAHSEGINDVAWSSDESYCVTASDDKSVKLWNVATGQAVSSFDGHESYVFCAGLNPSNARVDASRSTAVS